MVLTTDSANASEKAGEDERMKQYKNVAKHEDMRRRRNECSVEIRKQKGEDMMMKRRNLRFDDDDDEGEVSDNETKDNEAVIKSPQGQKSRMTHREIIAILENNPTTQQMRECFEAVRRQLSRTNNPPIDEVIKNGFLHALITALGVDDEKVRFEAAWALTNIVSGTSEQTMAAVQAGAVPPLVALSSPNFSPSLAEQCLWAIANIAGESAQMRDIVINSGGVHTLMAWVERLDTLEVSFVRTIAWSFSNLCRHKNPNANLEVLRVLSTGLYYLLGHPDKHVRQDSCWAVSYLTDGPDAQIQLAVDAGLIPMVVDFLKDRDSLLAPAIRVLGNVATGCDTLTQEVVNLGVLKHIIPILESCRQNGIVKESCWLLSNVLAGNATQIEAVIQEGLVPLLIEVLSSGDSKSQLEASWALANLAQGGTPQQMLSIVHFGGLYALCKSLKHPNNDLIVNALETLHALLNAATLQGDVKQMEAMRDQIEESQGMDYLEDLQNSDSEKIYDLSYRILTEYLGDDNMDDGANAENVQPGEFAF